MNSSETAHSIVIADKYGTILRVYNLGYAILDADEYNCIWNIASKNGTRFSMVVVEDYNKLGSIDQNHIPGDIVEDMNDMFGGADEATA
jgi:hypothetical protein